MAKKIPKKKIVNYEKLKNVFIFLIKLNLLAIPLYAIIYYNFSFEPLQNFVASVSFWILKVLGYDFSLEGNSLYIFVGSAFMQIQISWDSTGWKSLYILAALIVATPGREWKGKFLFILLSLPAVFAINIARIITTITTSLHFGLQYFDFLHLFLWRAVSIAVVLVFWYAFLKREKHNIR